MTEISSLETYFLFVKTIFPMSHQADPAFNLYYNHMKAGLNMTLQSLLLIWFMY